MKPDWSGLHVLVDDDERWPRDPVSQARAACEGGAHVIQLRIKHCTDARGLEWGRAIRALTRECGALLVVNDRFGAKAEAGINFLGVRNVPEAEVSLGILSVC